MGWEWGVGWRGLLTCHLATRSQSTSSSLLRASGRSRASKCLQTSRRMAPWLHVSPPRPSPPKKECIARTKAINTRYGTRRQRRLHDIDDGMPPKALRNRRSEKVVCPEVILRRRPMSYPPGPSSGPIRCHEQEQRSPWPHSLRRAIRWMHLVGGCICYFDHPRPRALPCWPE